MTFKRGKLINLGIGFGVIVRTAEIEIAQDGSRPKIEDLAHGGRDGVGVDPLGLLERGEDVVGLRVALASLGIAACGPAPSPPPDLLLVTLDTTRADAGGAYGADPSPTPHLDALAAAGMSFPQAPGSGLRHPSQLYEAFFEGIFLIGVRGIINRSKRGRSEFQ